MRELVEMCIRDRTSADLEGEEQVRLKDIEKILTCRELDKSNSKMVVVK